MAEAPTIPVRMARIESRVDHHDSEIKDLNSTVYGVRDCGGLVDDVKTMTAAVTELATANAQQKVWNKIMGVIAASGVVSGVGILISILTHTLKFP